MSLLPARATLWAPLAAAVALVILLFWRVGASFHRAWLDLPYTHGYLVAAVVVWLVVQHRRRLSPGPRMWTTGVWLVAGCSLAWLVGSAAEVNTVHQLLVLPMLAVAVAAVLGRDSIPELLPLALAFTFALPFWEVFTPPLQAATVFVATSLLAPLGVPAQVDGSVVVLEHGTLVISASCAGLAFFVSGAAIAYLYGLLFLERWRSRAIAVALGAGIAIVGNWIRVTSLVWIAHASEMQSSLVETHGVFGWAIFTVGLVVFVQAAKRLEPRGGGGGAPAPVSGGAAEAATDGAPPPTPLGRRIALVTAVAALGPALYWTFAALPETVELPGAIAAPAGWRPVADGPAGPVDTAATDGPEDGAWLPAFQGWDEARSATFTDGAHLVHADQLLFRTQSQGSELVHTDNRIALGDSLVRERRVLLPGPGRLVREAVIRRGEGGMLVRYWYNVAGVDTDSDVTAKALEAWAFFRRRGGAALVAIGSPCGPTDCAGAAEVLGAFMEGSR